MNRMSTEHYAELLANLSAAQRDRLAALEELAQFDAEQVRHWPRQLEETLAASDRNFEEAKLGIEETHAEAYQAIEEQYRGEEDRARSEYGRKSGEVDLQCDADLAAAEKKYKENCWLLQSILDDDSDASPKVQFERLQAQLEQGRERLTAQNQDVQSLSAEVAAIAASRWHRPSAAPSPAPHPTNRDDLDAAITAAVDSVRHGVKRLSRQIVPQLFSNWWALILLLAVIGGGLFAAMFTLIQPQWIGLAKLNQNEWAGVAGGVAAGLCLILFFILWNIAASKTAEVLEPLLQDAVNAQAWIQRWLKFAEAELRRAEQDYQTRYAAVVDRRDRSLAQFEEEYTTQTEQLETNRRQTQFALTQQRDAALKAAVDRSQQQRQHQEASYRTALATLESQWQQQRQQYTQQYDLQNSERTQRRQDLWTRCETNWRATLSQVHSEAHQLNSESEAAFLDWPDIAEASWTPPERIPSGIRLGDYLARMSEPNAALSPEQRQLLEAPQFRLPAVLPFPDSPSLLLKAFGSGREQAVAVLQAAMLRFLTLLPPGDARFTIVDPVALGENFASFMHLADYDDLLITNRIWTEPSQIEEQLAKLTEHMENVFQKYLRNEFESIEEYNHHAGEVAEPYRLLIVADFPNGFTERAAQRLVSIAASGARCGVHTLVSVDTQQPMPRGFDLSRLEAVATVMEWTPSSTDSGQFWVRLPSSHSLPLIPDAVPSPTLMAALIRKIGELSKDIRRVEVPFHRIAPRPEAYWTADSRGGIDVPLGRAGATKLQHMRLGSGTSQHVLIAGKTGSGKSTLLHVVVTDLALRYSPDEVEFYLIDFKKGVEFKTYASHRLPHARVIAIESDREFGTSVLERLDAVLKERGDLFRQVGAQDIRSFRDARPDVRMPRILLIVDEFQEFFIEDDKYSQTASLLLDRLVRQGRAFGIHVLLGSQTLGGAYSLARTTIGQMAVRIALQCSETDAHLILSENNSAARLLTRPGEAIYNNANGMMEGNNPFQVAWLDDDQRDGFLDRIETLADERDYPWPKPVVFEGNLPADPLRNPALCDLIAAGESTSKGETAPRMWLGDAVAIAGPAEIRFFPRSGANLLIVGQDPNSAFGILSAGVAALAAQSPGRLELLADPAGGVHQGRWTAVLNAVGERINCSSQPDGVIAEFAEEVTRRQEQPGAAAPWFLVIDDLSRYRELRKSDDDFGFGGFDKSKARTPGQMFGDVLKDGPAVGVHLIVWCDSYNNVDRWFSRQMLREFEMRAVFQMSAADSSNLIDNPAASRLGNNRAILYFDERGASEKFRPYGPPSATWLELLDKRATPTALSGRASDSNVVKEMVAQSSGPGTKSPAAQPAAETLPSSPKAWPRHPLENRPDKPAEPPPDDIEVADDLSAWTVT